MKWSSISKTRRFINRKTVLCLILLVILIFAGGIYVCYRSLHNVDLILELINGDENVEFEYIQLGGVVLSPSVRNLFVASSSSFGRGSTLFIRYFTAWKYPPDEVSKADNYKKLGWVDMRHRVNVSIVLKGNEGLI